MRRSSQRRSRLGLVVLVPASIVVVAAAVGWSRAQASPTREPLVRVSERDFKITAPRSIPGGHVLLRVHNFGPDTHELIVARLLQQRLPLRADGLTVDEDTLRPQRPVFVEGMERGTGNQVSIDLTPGRYVLFCNMAGHYLAGMHVTVVVR